MKSLFAETLYTGDEVLHNTHLLFEGAVVKGTSMEQKGEFLGKFPVVTPAFIDAHSHIGMERSGEPSATEGEANERMESLLFLADALDSVQMDDRAFRDSVEMGVLYSCVLPGSGNIVGGRTAVIRNYAHTTTDALIARSGVKAAFGYNPMSTRDWKGARPHTRMGALSLLRARLAVVKARLEKARKGSRAGEAALTAEEEVIRDILQGRQVLRVHVHKTDDIASLLRLQEEFGIRVTVEHACDVHDGRIFSALRARGVPVVFGPLDAFAYKVELRHENWRNVRLLLESGVEFGLMTDHPVIAQRNLLLELRWFIRCGLNRQDAIEIITRRNAQILGVDTFLGTLGKGKWASFSCWNGDPFDVTRYPVKVVAEGEVLFEEGE